jgi:hypothetical protein
MLRDGTVGCKLPSDKFLDDVIQLLNGWDFDNLSYGKVIRLTLQRGV